MNYETVPRDLNSIELEFLKSIHSTQTRFKKTDDLQQFS